MTQRLEPAFDAVATDEAVEHPQQRCGPLRLGVVVITQRVMVSPIAPTLTSARIAAGPCVAAHSVLGKQMACGWFFQLVPPGSASMAYRFATLVSRAHGRESGSCEAEGHDPEPGLGAGGTDQRAER